VMKNRTATAAGATATCTSSDERSTALLATARTGASFRGDELPFFNSICGGLCRLNETEVGPPQENVVRTVPCTCLIEGVTQSSRARGGRGKDCDTHLMHVWVMMNMDWTRRVTEPFGFRCGTLKGWVTGRVFGPPRHVLDMIQLAQSIRARGGHRKGGANRGCCRCISIRDCGTHSFQTRCGLKKGWVTLFCKLVAFPKTRRRHCGTHSFRSRCGLRKGWVTLSCKVVLSPMNKSTRGAQLFRTRVGGWKGGVTLDLVSRCIDVSKGAQLVRTRCEGWKGGAIFRSNLGTHSFRTRCGLKKGWVILDWKFEWYHMTRGTNGAQLFRTRCGGWEGGATLEVGSRCIGMICSQSASRQSRCGKLMVWDRKCPPPQCTRW
jgi:hypothetical protein